MTAEAPAFADFIRTLGRGPARSRALTLDEADAAMTMICSGTAEPVQIGALLVLLRFRGESPAELAGLVRAVRRTVALPPQRPVAELDWPTYADGKKRGLPWFVLSALLLAANGVRVFMHGFTSHQPPLPTPARALAALGIPAAATLADAAGQLAGEAFAYMPLERICPKLRELIDLRRLLGVRSSANTIARLLNPLAAPHLIQGVFHPPYRPLQQEAALLLEQPRLAVFKGGGGEAERTAVKPVEVFGLDQGRGTVTVWPPLLAAPAPEPAEAPLDASLLPALWRGEYACSHATAVVTGTAAIALGLLGRAASPIEADRLAARWWHERDRGRFSARPCAAPL